VLPVSEICWAHWTGLKRRMFSERSHPNETEAASRTYVRGCRERVGRTRRGDAGGYPPAETGVHRRCPRTTVKSADAPLTLDGKSFAGGVLTRSGLIVEIGGLGIDRDVVVGAGSRRNQRVEDLRSPAGSASLGDDLRELASHSRQPGLRRARRPRSGFACAVRTCGREATSTPMRSSAAVITETPPRPELAQGPSLLAAYKHRRVKDPRQSSSMVAPATSSISAAKFRSSGASRTTRATSAGERCSFLGDTGTSSATARPRTVTLTASPASTSRRTALMLLRSSRWGISRDIGSTTVAHAASKHPSAL